jgi:rod shape-determining protein MreC
LQGTEDAAAPAAKKPVVTASEGGAVTHQVANPGASGDQGTSAAKATPRSTPGNAPGSTASSSMTREAASESGARPAPRVNSAGEDGTAPRPVKPVNGAVPASSSEASASNGSGRPKPVTTPGSNSEAAASHVPAAATTTGASKTRVIVDGPVSRSNASDNAGAGAAASRSTSQAPTTPPKRKGPEIVPDDGSRPPSIERTAKPKPAVQPEQGPASPNGGR